MSKDLAKDIAHAESKLNDLEKRNWGQYGWICPVCGRGVSPFTSVCPCKFKKYNEVTYVGPPQWSYTTTSTPCIN